MASIVLKSNETYIPFLNKRISIVGGLDPLGLQNSSVRAYTTLLPGLNNVTGKIRYYSFYCWLIHNYFESNNTYSADSQLRYVRFAEYTVALLAYIDSENPMQGIAGSLYASRQIKNDTHQLIEATFKEDKKTTRGSYWTFKWGAFGQYYLGALRNLGLVDAHETTPNLYDLPISESSEALITGEFLASVFEESFSKKDSALKAIFINTINDADSTITNKTLKKLRTLFDLTKVPTKVERDALIQLLLQTDYPYDLESPTYYRKSTIIELLTFFQNTAIEKPTDRNFTFYAYECKGETLLENNDCMKIWYYYQFNEFWQYTNTAILNGLLDHLVIKYGTESVFLSNYLTELTKDTIEVLEILLEQDNLGDTNAYEVIKDKLLTTTVIELYNSLADTKDAEQVAYSFLIIWKLFEENQKHFDNLTKLFKTNNLGTYNRFSSLGYLAQLPKIAKQQTLTQYIYQFLRQHIIYRHQLVALKKMPSTLSKSTQKFQLEDNQISFLRNFSPTFTGPRIGNLISFLKDLLIIDSNHQLTKQGSELLSNLLINKTKSI